MGHCQVRLLHEYMYPACGREPPLPLPPRLCSYCMTWGSTSCVMTGDGPHLRYLHLYL